MGVIAVLTEPFVGSYCPRSNTNSYDYKWYYDKYVHPIITKKYLDKIHSGDKNG